MTFSFFSHQESGTYRCDRQSHIGRLDKALDEAQTKGWTVVDMKQDWKIIYPAEKH